MVRLTILDVFDIWTSEIFLSVWATNYCCKIYDDPKVRKFINSPLGALKYKKEYGKKDKRMLQIINEDEEWKVDGMYMEI